MTTEHNDLAYRTQTGGAIVRNGHTCTLSGVLCCFALFVCLTLLASFFLPSHLSFKNMYMYIYTRHVKIHCDSHIYVNTIK